LLAETVPSAFLCHGFVMVPVTVQMAATKHTTSAIHTEVRRLKIMLHLKQ
uniref:P1D n=1 Tax=Haemonchus placei TaxID=6290 RepID=A0A0N4VVD4_HAEPC